MEIVRLLIKIICSTYILLNSVCFFYAAIWYHKGLYPRSLRIFEGILGIMFLAYVIIIWLL